jgi:hypothetical protein
MSKIDITCPGCGEHGTREILKRFCISKHPEIKDDVTSGSYFEWKCPKCGQRFFIDDVFLYNDDERKFMVYYVPGFSKDALDIPTVVKTDADYDTEHSVLRVASGFVGFVEKIRILEEGLDDRAIEAVKAFYSAAFSEANGENVYSMIYEETVEPGALSFAVFLKDEDFTVEIPFEAYEQTKKNFSGLLGEPEEKAFLRIDQEWLAGALTKSDIR